jgi:hypothetical protein
MQRVLSALRAAGIERGTGFVRKDHDADRLFERYGFRDTGLRKPDLVLELTGASPAREWPWDRPPEDDTIEGWQCAQDASQSSLSLMEEIDVAQHLCMG